MLSEGTGQASQGFRGGPDVQLICIACPMPESLNEVVRDTVVGSNCGCANLKTMAGEVAVDSSHRQDLSKPVGQERTRQRLPVAQQEQGARHIATHGEISRHSQESAQGSLSPTIIHKQTLAEWVSFGSLDLDTHTGGRDAGVHC